MSAPDEILPEPFLELATRQFVDSQTGMPHFLEMPPPDARAAFARLQSAPVGKPSARIEDVTLRVGPTGLVPVRIVRPPQASGALPGLIYCHGGGWITGDVNTYDRLI